MDPGSHVWDQFFLLNEVCRVDQDDVALGCREGEGAGLPFGRGELRKVNVLPGQDAIPRFLGDGWYSIPQRYLWVGGGMLPTAAGKGSQQLTDGR